MKKEDLSYFYLIGFHIFIGILVYYIPFVSKLYGYSIFILGTYYVITKRNKNDEAVFIAAYLVGSEVFLRMTGGNPLYEITKYGVIYFVLIGMYYDGFSRAAVIYWLFLILLIPSVIIATYSLDMGSNIKNAIAFNLSGPVCLGISSVYLYKKKVLLSQMNSILLSMGLPILSCTIYLMLYTPSVRDVVTGTGSNFETSGGFGPNQVATVLGLGMFIFFSRIILESKSKLILLLNSIITFNIAYRGIVTFSRGGMITGLLMIVLLLFFLYKILNFTGRLKLNAIVIIGFVAFLGTWGYSSYQTSGLIDKRYSNQDAAGREKENQFTGREELAETELDMFFKNPVFGVGVGRAAQVRKKETGIQAATHSEITRMLAEHGILGILGLFILAFTPFFLFLESKFNLYLLCFFSFWILTINHAAMRIAAPAFVYALCLVNIHIGERPYNKKLKTKF